jgi:hypothetical protein
MALTDRDTTFNYLGELFLVGNYKTPFLNMIGGALGARSKQTRSMIFPVAQPYSLNSAAIPAFTETNLVGAATSITRARGIDYNTVMIFRERVEVSDLRQAAWGELTTLAAIGDQPVKDEFAFQKMAALKEMATDMELSFLTGTYAAAVNNTTAAQTNGIITACTTNTTAAGSVYITKALIDGAVKEMAANGAVFENMVLFANSWNINALNDLYGYAPEDRKIGGTNINKIITPFCEMGVVYDPFVTAGTILIADMNYCYPVFMLNDGKAVRYDDLARVAGATAGEFIAFAGIDYGPEEYHSTITGIKVT